jgi:hypothetical protein
MIEIAPDFGPYSRRVIGCILYVFGLSRNAEDGSKDKQFRSLYKIYVPKNGNWQGAGVRGIFQVIIDSF